MVKTNQACAGSAGGGKVRAGRYYGARRARGQALILAVLSLLVFCIGVLVLFNTGQTVNKKVQLNNTADAAAYSAAVQQARAFNMVAYMNRAQVANEVAIAQMVSVHSYMNYLITGTKNAKNTIQVIAAIADITVVGIEIGAALQEVVTALGEVKTVLVETRDLMQPALSGLIALASGANRAYSEASLLMIDGQSLEIPLVVNTVIKENTKGASGSTDKEASLNAKSVAVLEQQVVQAMGYAKRYSIPKGSVTSQPRRTAEADRFVNVVMEARDGFSANRAGSTWILHRYGGTDLVGYNRWVALDTLGLHFRFLLVKKDVPLAWGGAAAVMSGQPQFSRVANPGINNGAGWTSPYPHDKGRKDPYGGALTDGNKAQKGARDNALSDPADPKNKAILNGYEGLQAYNDVPNGKALAPYSEDNSTDVGPIFSVLVEQAMTDVRTSDNIQGMGGTHDGTALDISAPDKAQNNKMSALASAQVYFSRPRELFPRNIDPDYRELGSLFSPYWQARLVDTPTTVKAEVFGVDMIP